jgi:hypothetical protein
LANQANLLQRVYVMRAASSRIWFTMTTIQQTNKSNLPLIQIRSDNPKADTAQLIMDPTVGLSNKRSHGYSEHRSPTGSESKGVLVDGYTQLVTDRVQAGWTCDLVTILFSPLTGTRSSVIGKMMDEVQRIYSTLVTRVHRKPKTAPNDELPVFVGAADLPVYKRDRSAITPVFCNGGLHFHLLVLIPPGSRLKEPLAEHLEKNRDLYAGTGTSIQRIHVEPVTEVGSRLVDYVLKTVLNGRLSYDEAVVVLPPARAELS